MTNTGRVWDTYKGGTCKIVHYENSRKVIIEFIEYPYTTTCSMYHLRAGRVRNPMYPSVHGIGFMGVGEYNSLNEAMSTWEGMLKRCYSPKDKRHHRYGERGVVVCKEWHNFQNFAVWFEEKSVKSFQLDKDLINTSSMVYSPDTCSFVPPKVNTLLTTSNTTRGKYPVGVHLHKRGKFVANYRKENKINYLGKYDTPEEAFLSYKVAKEKQIKEVATEEWRLGNICDKVYETLMNWKVVPFPD